MKTMDTTNKMAISRRVLRAYEGGATLTAAGDTDEELCLHVPAGVRLAHPVTLTNQLAELSDCDTHLDLHIALEAGAAAQVILADRAAADLPFRTVRTIRCDIAPEASLALCTLEELNTQAQSTEEIHVACGGHVSIGSFSLTGGQTDRTVTLDFVAPGADCDIYGIVVAADDRQVTNSVTVTHQTPRCTDRELFKYILDDTAVGRFNGLVRVQPHCPQADSRQLCRAVCLTRDARMHAQPQLIIDTDDVSCSHGSTVGQLDEAALFYMQQRGIPLAEARLLLLTAFLSEVIDRCPIESVRDRVQLLAESRLRGDSVHCATCGICSK